MLNENTNTEAGNAEEAPTLEGLIEALGGDQTKQPDSDNSENQDTNEGETTPPANDEDTLPNDEGDATSSNNDSGSTGTDDRGAQAFAKMRVENKNLQKMVEGIAEVLGIQDTKDPEAVNNAIKDKILEAQAKKAEVPKEMLARLQYLEEKDAAAEETNNRNAAFHQFQQVKSNFNLSDKELEAFATELQMAGLNPFANKLDLVKEYKNLHFDTLVQNEVAKAVANEMKRSTKASTQGTTPSSNQNPGGNNTGTEKITSVNELTNWFKSQTR